MMAKAHVAVGMAAAYTISMPGSVPEALPVVTGAALGCLICDIDCENSREKTDSSRWRIAMFLVAVAAVFEDHLIDGGMLRRIAESGSYLWCAGLAGFALTCTFASVSSHRGFSHSLLALVLETVFIYLIFPMSARPFAAAFISHQALDLTNKRPVKLLYPLGRGLSLRWFYADRIANRVCEIAGVIWLAAAVIADITL